MAVAANTPLELIDAVYGRLEERSALGRERLGRSLTFAEKILSAMRKGFGGHQETKKSG